MFNERFYARELNEKDAAALREAMQNGQTCAGNNQCDAIPETGRPSLRDCVARQRHDALVEGRKAHCLTELSDLLDRNPELARILDLIEIVRR